MVRTMTISIPREYDEEDVLARLLQVVPDLNFGPSARIEDIEVEPPYANVEGRTLTLSVSVRLSDAAFAQVFQAPIS